MLSVGKPAPAFSLPETNGGTISLESLCGSWVVLYFYPKDNTPGCTQESCDFRDQHSALLAAGVKVLGVSPDSLKSHANFTAKYELPFPLLSDPEHTMLTAYGVWKEKSMYGRTYMGVERTTVLIGPDGVVREVWEKVKVKGHVEQVLAAVLAQQGK